MNVVVNDPDDRKDVLKTIGGSHSDHWNNLPLQSGGAVLLDRELRDRDPQTADQCHRRRAGQHRGLSDSHICCIQTASVI